MIALMFRYELLKYDGNHLKVMSSQQQFNIRNMNIANIGKLTRGHSSFSNRSNKSGKSDRQTKLEVQQIIRRGTSDGLSAFKRNTSVPTIFKRQSTISNASLKSKPTQKFDGMKFFNSLNLPVFGNMQPGSEGIERRLSFGNSQNQTKMDTLPQAYERKQVASTL
jgi:hypothetical protein